MNQLDPQRYSGARTFFRIAGPLCLVAGFLMFIGMASSMMSSMNAFPGGQFGGGTIVLRGGGMDAMLHPDSGPNPIMGFVGVLLIFAGGVMTKLGYFGTVARYVAGETAPVARDTFNYMAKGSRGAVRDIASAVADGLRREGSAPSAEAAFCTSCGAPALEGARFCSKCGKGLGA